MLGARDHFCVPAETREVSGYRSRSAHPGTSEPSCWTLEQRHHLARSLWPSHHCDPRWLSNRCRNVFAREEGVLGFPEIFWEGVKPQHLGQGFFLWGELFIFG